MSKFSPFSSSTSNPSATPSTKCQKCLGRGHYTYQCKKSRPYVSRPSRTQLLDNPKLREKEKEKRKEILSEGIPEEFRNKTGVADALLTAREVTRASEAKIEQPPKKKLKRNETNTQSEADSDSETQTDSDCDSSSSRSSSGSDSDASSRPPRRKELANEPLDRNKRGRSPS